MNWRDSIWVQDSVTRRRSRSGQRSVELPMKENCPFYKTHRVSIHLSSLLFNFLCYFIIYIYCFIVVRFCCKIIFLLFFLSRAANRKLHDSNDSLRAALESSQSRSKTPVRAPCVQSLYFFTVDAVIKWIKLFESNVC